MLATLEYLFIWIPIIDSDSCNSHNGLDRSFLGGSPLKPAVRRFPYVTAVSGCPSKWYVRPMLSHTIILCVFLGLSELPLVPLCCQSSRVPCGRPAWPLPPVPSCYNFLDISILLTLDVIRCGARLRPLFTYVISRTLLPCFENRVWSRSPFSEGTKGTLLFVSLHRTLD